MQAFIRVGDKTTGDGEVLAGSPKMIFEHRPLARKGDPVTCPKKGHGDNHIAEGDELMTDNGIPIALHGHRCECGCTLISSLPHAGKL